MEEHDIAIVGAGGAGLTAAIYAARARRETVVFEGAVTGGQIATTDIVENFPGFPDGIGGFDLGQQFLQQAEKFGASVRYEVVTELQRTEDGRFLLHTEAGDHLARAVIVTTGAEYNKLGIRGEKEYTGRGVSWCATCDGAFFAGKEVAVIGGGDAALDEGLFLTRYATKVHLVHRRSTLRAAKVLQERAFAEPKFLFNWNSVAESIEGDGQDVTGVILRDVETGERRLLEVAAVFIYIGQTPTNALLQGLVQLDPGGHAVVDLQMQTSVPGLFVAGDVRMQAARQLIAACGDGATAAIAAEHYLG